MSAYLRPKFRNEHSYIEEKTTALVFSALIFSVFAALKSNDEEISLSYLKNLAKKPNMNSINHSVINNIVVFSCSQGDVL